MKKRRSRKIRELSNAIGEKITTRYEWQPISGEELLLSGFGQTEQAKDIDPKGSYEISVPVHHHHSVKKELKRAFKKKGTQGLVDYAYEVIQDRGLG